MPDVKPTSRHRSRRELNLDATRAHIVQAAGTLFLAQGYGRTTLAAIARDAGVAVQTVYNTVGNKAALLGQVFEASVRGPQAPRSVPEYLQERTQQVTDPRGMTHLLAEWFTDVHARMGPMWRVLEEAAAHDEDVARLRTLRDQRRLDHYGMAAKALANLGGLPEGLDLEDTAALIWAVGHPRVYRALVEERGWSAERYKGWVQRTLGTAIAHGGPSKRSAGPTPEPQ